MKSHKKLSSASKRRAKPRSMRRVVRAPIFSGKSSTGMWKHINEAKTIADIRMALYVVACRCQELESEVKAANS